MSQWFLSLIFVIFLISIPKFEIKVFGHRTLIARLMMDIIIIIAAVLTFIYLLIKVKKAIHLPMLEKREQHRSSSIVCFNLKIPILMVLTFIVFNTSSSIYLFHVSEPDITFALLDICGWCSDPCIYVFLQKRVRLWLFSNCMVTNKSQVRDINMPPST